MRTFKVVNKKGCLYNEYISENEEYFLVSTNNSVIYRRIRDNASSFMNLGKFRIALQQGDIIFTD